MVELSKKKLTKGTSSFILLYKNKYFAFSNALNMKAFQKNPTLF
jgi:YHS domain-containing protein